MNFFIDKEKIMELIRPIDLLNSICLIIADLSRPWMIKDSLIKWTKLIHETFEELIKKLPENLQKKIKDNGKKKIRKMNSKKMLKNILNKKCLNL